MYARLATLSLLPVLAVSLEAQMPARARAIPTTVKLEILPAAAFPPQFSFQLELKAKLGAIDRMAFAAKRKQVPSQEDMLFELPSTVTNKWDIAYIGNKPKISGSSKKASFKFPKPPKQEADVIMPTVEFEGALKVFVNGELKSSMPIGQIEPVPFGETFLFKLNNMADAANPTVEFSIEQKVILPGKAVGQNAKDATPRGMEKVR